MNSLIIFFVMRCFPNVFTQYSETLRQVKGYSLTGSPLYSFPTDSIVSCSAACRRYNCTGFAVVDQQCNVYKVSGSTIIYAPGSPTAMGFLNLDRLAVARLPSMTVPSAPWGTLGAFYYCAKNKGVNAINVWNAAYVNPSFYPDDVGVTQVQIVCSGTDGNVDSSSSIQGPSNAVAIKNSFQCPSASFISAVRFMLMPDQGLMNDDAAMVGLAVMCNDPVNTTHALASGEGTTGYPWTAWLSCDAGFVVCGFALKIDPATSDLSAVNGMSTACCLIT